MELWVSTNTLIGKPVDGGQQLDEVTLAATDAAELRSLAALFLEAATELDELHDDPLWHLHYYDSEHWPEGSADLILTRIQQP